ncbi:hypothetical protein MRX96_057404 [Rhipicephalus microplus]
MGLINFYRKFIACLSEVRNPIEWSIGTRYIMDPDTTSGGGLPLVLTHSDGEKKVVGSVYPLIGAIALDADKLKDSLSETVDQDPRAPLEVDPAE